MTRKRIGLVMPARDPAAAVSSGSGIVPRHVADDLRAALTSKDKTIEIFDVRLKDAFVKNGKVYAAGLCLSELDAVFWLYYVGANAFEWEILKTLTQTTTVLPSPHAGWKARDKSYAHSLLRNAGLPTADFCTFPAHVAQQIAQELAAWGDVLIKPVLGDFGHGICRVNNPQSFVDTVAYAQSFSKEPLQIFCERFDENDLGKWISATVINGDVVFGYRKRPDAFVEGWKVYDPDCIGGNADYVDPAPVRDMAQAAAKALGCEIIGFDFIFSTRLQQYIIVDENTLPGMYADCFDAAGKGSLADMLAAIILPH